jgi:hypothetical protein
MIAALLLLLAAAPERVVLIDEVVAVPAKGWRDFAITLRQRPAVLECRYTVSGGSGVRALLLQRSDVERLREGRPHQPIAATAFVHAGALRAAPPVPGDYSLVLDNALEGRGPALVRLTVSLTFGVAQPAARELPAGRRLTVICLSALFLFAVAGYVGWRLHIALGRPPHGSSPETEAGG